VAAVAMRVDGRTNAAEVLRAWAEEQKVPLIGVLRETQVYVKSLERGLTMFDLQKDKIAVDLAQWQPILDWLKPVVNPVVVPEARREPILPQRRPSVLGARPFNDASRMSLTRANAA
jgi:chromosome partitioning protein